MKRKCLAIAACLLFGAPVLADTTWVEVGTAYTPNSIPFWGTSYDAMRFQALYLQEDINTAGEIVAFGMHATADPPSEFYKVKVLLCHTGAESLKAEFASNYGGNTPQLMLEKDTLVVGTGQNYSWYDFPCSFVYNNTENLLVEISWRGDAGARVRFYRNGNGDYRRAWAYNDTATHGSVDNVEAYYARFGFLPVGAEDERVIGARPVLSVTPSHGAGGFVIRAEGAVASARYADVHDVTGRFVERLLLRSGGTGRYVTWDAANASAGVYFVRLEDAGRTLSCRVVKTE